MIQSLQETLGGKPKVFSIDRVKELHIALMESDDGLYYLEKIRGLSKETIQKFLLGYNKELHAISIPYFKRGEVVAIKYRFINPENERRYHSERGSQPWVFYEEGIDASRSKGAVLITEGEFDLMACWQAGIRNVIGCGGKDAYGVWIELLDKIPKVYIAYDNDEAGKTTSLKFAERLGTDKCMEVTLPTDTKDLNDFFHKNTKEEFSTLIKEAKPYYKYEFKGIGDVINNLRFKQEETIELSKVPGVKFEKDWLVMVSGVSNVGKTSVVLNFADELTKKNIPTLILPFERGVSAVGERFLQVMFNKTKEDFGYMNDSEWTQVITECGERPVYFALPKKNDIVDTIIKSKRLFDTRVVIIDHMDYLVRNVAGNREAEISNTLQALKRVAEENKILMMIVSHTRKVQTSGSLVQREPTMEDLKGSSSLFQDPECVIMLTKPEEGQIKVNVVKNKGEMKHGLYEINVSTGRMLKDLNETAFK